MLDCNNDPRSRHSGWWFGTFFIFPYIGNNHPNWLSYFSEGFKPPTSIYIPILNPRIIAKIIAPGHFPFFSCSNSDLWLNQVRCSAALLQWCFADRRQWLVCDVFGGRDWNPDFGWFWGIFSMALIRHITTEVLGIQAPTTAVFHHDVFLENVTASSPKRDWNTDDSPGWHHLEVSIK